MLTLGQAILDEHLQESAGYCSQEKLIREINHAQEILSMSVVREHQTELIRVISDGHCIALPREAESATHWKLESECSRSHTLQNLNFEFLDGGPGFDDLPSTANIVPRQIKPTFRHSSFPDFRVIALSEQPEQDGIYLSVQGYESRNIRVFSKGGYNGEKLPVSQGRFIKTLDDIDCEKCQELAPLVYTQRDYSEISGLVLRDADGAPYYPAGYIYIYAYQPCSNKMQLISYIPPYETTGQFTTYRVGGVPLGCCYTFIVRIIKKFIPARHPDDILYIQNLRAIEAVIRAERFRYANDFNSSQNEMQRAMLLLEGKERRQNKGRNRVLRLSHNYGYRSGYLR